MYVSTPINRHRFPWELDKASQTSGLGPGIACDPGAAERVSMGTGGPHLSPNRMKK